MNDTENTDDIPVVKVFNSRIDAEIAKSYLESHGINPDFFR